MEDYKVPKEEIGRALAQFYNCAVLRTRRAAPCPSDLKERLTADFLKKNMCAPIEKKEGTLLVAVEDPYDLTRLDAIKAMNLAPRHEFVVGAASSDIIDYINAQLRRDHGRRARRPDLGPDHHGAGLAARRRRSRRRIPNAAARARRDGQRDREALPTRSSSTPTTAGASDIHVEPYGKTAPTHGAPAHRRRLHQVPGDPARPPQRRRAALQDHVQAGHRGEAQAPGRQDPLQGPDGHHRAARGHHPHLGRQRGRGHAHPGRLASRCPSRRWASPTATSPSSRRSCEKPYGICLVVGPTGSGKTTTLHSGLGYINTVDMKIWTAEDPVEITQAGPAPGAGAPQDRLHLRGGHARVPARRPRRDHGRRDARPRDGGHRHRGLAHRPPRLLDPAHELRAGDDHPPAGHGHRPLQLRGRAARASWPSAWCARSARTARRSTPRPRRSSRS